MLDYFNEYIFGFIFHDIESCIKAKANFGVATLLMAYTEKISDKKYEKENIDQVNSILSKYEYVIPQGNAEDWGRGRTLDKEEFNIESDKEGWNNRPHSLSLTIPPLATIVLKLK